jgi:NAD-dependent dihydropyrimidine dehydrogenase PreA subunit
MRALEIVDGKAVLHWPERCDACSVCDHICPEGAISLPFQIVFAPSQSTVRREK